MKTVGLLIAWIGLTIGSFWHFQGRYFLPVQGDWKAPALAELPSDARFPELKQDINLVVNFWNPDCPCSAFAEDHVRELYNRFSGRNTAFVTVIVSKSANGLKQAKDRKIPGRLILDKDFALVRDYGIYAAPAVVIFNKSDQAVYRGAYNLRRFCDDPESAFAEKTLVALEKNEVPNYESLPFYGCANHL